jgi:hypothetical protein
MCALAASIGEVCIRRLAYELPEPQVALHLDASLRLCLRRLKVMKVDLPRGGGQISLTPPQPPPL